MTDALKTPAEHDADAEAIRKHFGYRVVYLDKLPLRNSYFVVTHSLYDNSDMYRAWLVSFTAARGMMIHQFDTAPIVIPRPEF